MKFGLTLFFSAAIAVISVEVAVLFFGQATLKPLMMVALMSFFTSIGLMTLNTFQTRPSDNIMGKWILSFFYLVIWLSALLLVFATPGSKVIIAETIAGFRAMGWGGLISVLAGIAHLVLLKKNIFFTYPPEDPPRKGRPKLVK